MQDIRLSFVATVICLTTAACASNPAGIQSTTPKRVASSPSPASLSATPMDKVSAPGETASAPFAAALAAKTSESGPMSMITDTSAVIGMRSSVNAGHEQTLLEDMRLLGGKILSLGESDADIAFESHLPEEVRNVLYLPTLQLMANYRATAKGLDPDNPRNLSAVIYLDVE